MFNPNSENFERNIIILICSIVLFISLAVYIGLIYHQHRPATTDKLVNAAVTAKLLESAFGDDEPIRFLRNVIVTTDEFTNANLVDFDKICDRIKRKAVIQALKKNELKVISPPTDKSI